jgi:hypothetical protein
MVQPLCIRKFNGGCGETDNELIPNFSSLDAPPRRGNIASTGSKTVTSSDFLSLAVISSIDRLMRENNDLSNGRRSQVPPDETSVNSRHDSVADSTYGSMARARSQNTSRRSNNSYPQNVRVASRSASPCSGSVESSQYASISSSLSANAPVFRMSTNSVSHQSRKQLSLFSEDSGCELSQPQMCRGSIFARESTDEAHIELVNQQHQLSTPSQLELSFVQRHSSTSAMPNEFHILPLVDDHSSVYYNNISSEKKIPFPGFISPIKLSRPRRKSPRNHDKKIKYSSTDTTDSASLTSLSRQSSTYRSTFSSSLAPISRPMTQVSSSFRASHAEPSSLIEALEGLDFRQNKNKNKNDFYNVPVHSMSENSTYSRSLEQNVPFPPILPTDRVAAAEKRLQPLDSESSYSNQDGRPIPVTVKEDWLLEMNEKLRHTPIGKLNPEEIPVSSIMNGWAKTKTSKGAKMVEVWLRRIKAEEYEGNPAVTLTNKMFTIAVDAWAKSGQKGAAKHAEDLLQEMYEMHRKNKNSNLIPTTEIFNAVINAWARSGEDIAPTRAEQILDWMKKLQKSGQLDVRPDKYSYNTAIHAWAKKGGIEAAERAQALLRSMERMFLQGDAATKPDTITYNIVINSWAKSGGIDAAIEAEKLLNKMHKMYEEGNTDVKPNFVTYGAVIDSWAKSGNEGAAERADTILANMIRIHQSDPVIHADLRPNTYVFNTVINAWAKSEQRDAAKKAEEMLVAMGRLHACGIPGLKPDAFTYTAVIDAWARRKIKGSANRALQLLEKMEYEYESGDEDLKPHIFAYNAVISALAKSEESGSALRAESILRRMLDKYRQGFEDLKPTTINFNTVLNAWAKSGDRKTAEHAEQLLHWMNQLFVEEALDVRPDTITFNAVIDAWARSGDRRATARAEQLLEHMEALNEAGHKNVNPDAYTFNTVINAWAKSGEPGSASRAEHLLSVMEERSMMGNSKIKPNTRTFTSVIDAWAKSGERGAAHRAESLLKKMRALHEAGYGDIEPNAHTYNAVINACAFSKYEDDFTDAIRIAFSVFEEFSALPTTKPDAYTYASLLSVCSNILPRHDQQRRFACAKLLFERCRDSGHVNEFVLRKLRQTVTEKEYIYFVANPNMTVDQLPKSWTKNCTNHRRNSIKKL